ncbi:MAG: PIN domain-containing protein, partial [Verrucomicrobiota bacterium]
KLEGLSPSEQPDFTLALRILVIPCVPGTPDLYRRAVRLSQRYKIHPYDGAILAAAQELGAQTVYSEDLSHGQTYDGVKVVNPFLNHPD